MSIQVNVRLDERLLGEIDAISKVLHVTRTEWLRGKISLAVKQETLNLKEAIALEYAKGTISKDELIELLGSDSKEIIYIVKRLREGKQFVDAITKSEIQ